ncbi:MAG: hypothetical protein AABM31_06220 [Actinomycetota bacterium]
MGEPSSPDLIERAEDSGAIDLERANLYRLYALSGDSRLPDAYQSSTPWRGTLLAEELERNLTRMEPGPERRAVAEVLRAPPDPSATTCSTETAVLPNSLETDHFYIQYDQSTLHPSLTIQDYADSLEGSYATEVEAFRWAAPPSTSLGQSQLGGKYHVRVDDLGTGLYGFVSSQGTYAGPVGDNPNTTWNDGDATATCMALNQSYSGFPGTPRKALDATTAHEYNHSLQYGYGALNGSNRPDANFIEGGATWMEDEAQDAANDNYFYLYPAFTSSMGAHPSNAGQQYSYWLTFRGITERFGANVPGGAEQVMQDFWELTSRNEANMLTAMQQALAGKGRTLAETYHDYAIAAKLMRTCGGGYFLPYCFEEAGGYISAAGGVPASQGTLSTLSQTYTGSLQDDYALNWVRLPSAGTYNLTLSNTSAGGQMRATVACNTGSAVAIAPFAATVAAGQAIVLTSFTPSGCLSTPVAVITNEAQTAPNPGSSTARSYTLSTAAPSGPATSPVVPPPPAEQAPDNSLAPAGPAGSVAAGPQPVADTIRPVLSRLALSRRRFRAARSGSAISAAPLGTRLRYRLSEAATVTARYERRATGRRAGGRCRAVTRRNRGRAGCLRWVLVRGSARHSGKAGANAFRPTGRLGGRSLKPAVYRLRLSAKDAARNTSRTRRSAAFRIVRR